MAAAQAHTLKAATRESGGKGVARQLRREGRVPAVLYGHGETTRTIMVDGHELEQLFSKISVENTIITLKIEGERGADVKALVREVQIDPVRRNVLHVDFYQVHAGERVSLEVPIHTVGTAAGVRAGGILQENRHDIAIRCLAEQIPEAIEVDVSALEIGDSIHVRDLTVPPGVTIEEDPDLTICSVLPPSVAGVEAEPAAVEPPSTEPEVIRRAREEGESEA